MNKLWILLALNFSLISMPLDREFTQKLHDELMWSQTKIGIMSVCFTVGVKVSEILYEKYKASKQKSFEAHKIPESKDVFLIKQTRNTDHFEEDQVDDHEA